MTITQSVKILHLLSAMTLVTGTVGREISPLTVIMLMIAKLF